MQECLEQWQTRILASLARVLEDQTATAAYHATTNHPTREGECVGLGASQLNSMFVQYSLIIGTASARCGPRLVQLT